MTNHPHERKLQLIRSREIPGQFVLIDCSYPNLADSREIRRFRFCFPAVNLFSSPLLCRNIEILIKFLENRPTVFSAHTNVIKITIPKNGGHLRADTGRRNTPHHSYVAVSGTQ